MTAITHYGPYDVTDYATWQAALDAAISAGNSIMTTPLGGNKVIFTEYTGGGGAGTSALSFTDDGTNYTIKVGGTAILKIRQSDGQLLLDSGVDADAW